MPSAFIAADTFLLDVNGWSKAARIGTGQAQIFGCDRLGQLTLSDVTMGREASRSRAVVVGTDTALGVFASETRLVTRDGSRRDAASVADSGNPGDAWFENVVRFPPTAADGPGGEGFGAALYECAPFSEGDFAAFRSRSFGGDPQVKVHSEPVWAMKEVAGERFCVVATGGLRGFRGRALHELTRELVRATFHNDEEEREEFDLEHAGICLWYLSALTALGVGYRLTYDSLQHSLLFSVSASATAKTPFRSCRTAFNHDELRERTIVNWKTGGWLPVASGFLIAGQ